MKSLIDKLEREHLLTHTEFIRLLENRTPELDEYLFERARNVRLRHYGRDVYVRGLIEFTSYCKNDCYYCGLRRSNAHAQRYRLTPEEILDCCDAGYALGFRTFVLQGGEDPYYTDEKLCALVWAVKKRYPDCAVTLSAGEKNREGYQAYFDAGADRYLLRHETANATHYGKLHPADLSLQNRQRCLWDLKDIGYQVGCGFMVGSPYQSAACVADDLLFLHAFNPHMVGIGPFIPHHNTPFAAQPAGSLELTLFLLGIIRLMLPKVLLPATTALGTIHPLGREKGILAGANVVMPNLSPRDVRGKYLLYDNKICTGDEAAECRACLAQRMQSIGYQVVTHRGDYPVTSNPTN
ncbi:MAG: [FeFe] hydrogenase H-cluster radical SAM maturase HydE [Eubacteriales bacterium]|nr:[FeFe] hydrogenase H-cluster radical SAM maturase HydE [Eubacteriales bacterium]